MTTAESPETTGVSTGFKRSTRLLRLGAISGLMGGLAFGVIMVISNMLPMVGMLIGQDDATIGFIVHIVISAIIGEELGFVGICALVAAFGLIVYRGLRASMRAVDAYGTYLALGISVFVGLQAFTNLAVAMGMLPTKGLVLPFLSYGGSSLLVNCLAVGVLLNVSRPRVAVAMEGYVAPTKEQKRRKTGRVHGRRMEDLDADASGVRPVAKVGGRSGQRIGYARGASPSGEGKFAKGKLPRKSKRGAA